MCESAASPTWYASSRTRKYAASRHASTATNSCPPLHDCRPSLLKCFPHGGDMYHYNPETALEELRDEAVLPHPVHLRDMILRTKLEAPAALDLNRDFQEYQTQCGKVQKLAQGILERLAAGVRKAS